MSIISIDVRSKEELFKGLRRVTLEGQPNEFVYQNSQIDIQYLSVDGLIPAQRYVLRQDLDRVKQLRHEVSVASENRIRKYPFNLKISILKGCSDS